MQVEPIAALCVRRPGVPGDLHLEPGFSAAMRTSQVTAAHGVQVIVRPWSDSRHAIGAASLALAAPETFA